MITHTQIFVATCDVCGVSHSATNTIGDGCMAKVYSPSDFGVVLLLDGRTVCMSHISISRGDRGGEE